jgi:hypothetical protein
VKGSISDLSSEEFLIRMGEKTALFGSFLIEGLPQIDSTFLRLDLKNSGIIILVISLILEQVILYKMGLFR